jgi:hypothetical protein
LAGGFALSIIGSVMLFIGLSGVFAILYSIGIIASLVGTGVSRSLVARTDAS